MVLGEHSPLISTCVDRANPRALGDVSLLCDAHTCIWFGKTVGRSSTSFLLAEDDLT
jgi:hypothetical protein